MTSVVADWSCPVKETHACLQGFLVDLLAGEEGLFNLSGSRLTVSDRKLNFQPHQTRGSPRAFFQEMAFEANQKNDKQGQLQVSAARRKAARRSSTWASSLARDAQE